MQNMKKKTEIIIIKTTVKVIEMRKTYKNKFTYKQHTDKSI